MECVFPGSTKLSDGYTSKYNKIKRLLSLGQKLSMLTQKFGQGILGLVQCYEHDAHKKSFPYLSDQRSALNALLVVHTDIEQAMFNGGRGLGKVSAYLRQISRESLARIQ